MSDWRQTLLGFVVDDSATVTAALSQGGASSALDARSSGLIRVAAACAVRSPEQTIARVVGEALDAGATPEQIVDVLVVTAPLIGSSRAVDAAGAVATALRNDTDDALESLERMEGPS